MPMSEETATIITPGRILQLGLGFWASKTLLSAIELGVFKELASGAVEIGRAHAATPSQNSTATATVCACSCAP